jgi:hypothetical protein
MGAVEEGGKVAVSITEGLKQQPFALAMIVLNLVFIAFVTWLAHTINQRTEGQYRIKDEQNAVLLNKLDTIGEVRAEVAKIGERVAGNATLAKGLADTIERLSKSFDDHENRIRILEQRK